MPWYIARGNHDGLIQGNAPASTDLFRAIATGCLKVFPSAALDPARFANADESEVFRQIGDPSFIATLLAGGRPVPPDPDRRVLSTTEYKDIVGRGNGYRYVVRGEPRLERRRDLLRLPPAQGDRVHLARHRRRGRRLDGQPRRPAVPLAREDAEGGAERANRAA